jgi:hypothetical protein
MTCSLSYLQSFGFFMSLAVWLDRADMQLPTGEQSTTRIIETRQQEPVSLRHAFQCRKVGKRRKSAPQQM